MMSTLNPLPVVIYFRILWLTKQVYASLNVLNVLEKPSNIWHPMTQKKSKKSIYHNTVISHKPSFPMNFYTSEINFIIIETNPLLNLHTFVEKGKEKHYRSNCKSFNVFVPLDL